jgi:hypothetical protein
MDEFISAAQGLQHLELEAISGERVVWLLGAGFSKPLGGPLFGELMNKTTTSWVSAWLRHAGFSSTKLESAPNTYQRGVDGQIWSNPEECL